jgi:hypothetical protein
MGRTAALLISAALVGCDWSLPEPPARTTTLEPKPFVTSTISMPLNLDVEGLRAGLLAELQSKPLAAGRSPELGIRLLAEEKTIFEEPRKIVDVPYKAASCGFENVTRTFTERVKTGTRAVDCLINPLKWGKCIKDVFEDVVRTEVNSVQRCIPEQVEVFRMVTSTVERITPKLFDTSAFLNYQVNVKSADVQMIGSSIKVSIGVNAPVSADIKQNLLIGNVTAKGALACSADASATATGTVNFTSGPDGIVINTEVGSVDLDVTKFCVPGAVELTKAWGFSSVEAFATREIVKKAVHDTLLKQARKALAKAAGDVSISTLLLAQAEKLRTPIDIGSGARLYVDPKAVTVSQLEGRLEGGRQVIAANAGLRADVALGYGANIAMVGGPISVGLGTTQPGFQLVPRGMVSLERISAVVKETAQAQAGPALRKEGFELGNVDIYQSGPLIVVAVEIKSRSWWRPTGRIYMAGRPVYEAALGSIRFADFDFTADTRNWLVKQAITAAYPFAKQHLAPKMVFPANKQLDDATKAFRDLKMSVGSGDIKGELTVRAEAPELRTIWISGGLLNFDVLIRGQAAITPGG